MAGADTPNGKTPQAGGASRGLMFVVWGLGFAIIAMIILLILGVMLGWNKKDGPPPQPDPTAQTGASTSGGPAVLEIDTAPESRLYTLAGDGARIALHIASPTGDEIIVVDTKANRVISRVKLKPAGGLAPP